MEDHSRSERILAESGLDWTALRPMMLDDSPSTDAARPMEPNDSLLSKVSREALARMIVEMIGSPLTVSRAIPVVAGSTTG